MGILTLGQKLLLCQTAIALGLSPDALAAQIAAESSWNPQAVNRVTGDAGLIQIDDTNARALGFASAADMVARCPTIEAQLQGPVMGYLKPFAPFRGAQSLNMAIFAPAYRNSVPETVFPDYIRAVNPGITCVQDYVNFVARHMPADFWGL
jgi:hypothetical protein